LTEAFGLAFDSTGSLYETQYQDGRYGLVNKFTPDGTPSGSTGVPTTSTGLAFDSASNLYVGCLGGIYEVPASGVLGRMFGYTGAYGGTFLAFQPALIPEPSTWAMLGLGAAVLQIFRRRK